MSFAILRQSTAVDVLIGPFVDSTDGDTEEAALTINRADVLLSKNGQGAVQKTDVTAAASDADGFYNCELDATDTNTVGQLVLYVHVAGALAVRHDFQIVEEEPYDDIFAASAVGYLKPTTAGRDLDVSAGGEAGLDWANIGTKGSTVDLSDTTIKLCDTTTAVTNQVTADATAISGDATTADNLETLFNGNEGFYTAYMGPRGPGVYLNDAAANTTTVNGVDGTVGNPVSTIAAAKTLADSMSLDRIYLVNDSLITLTATMEDYEFIGIGAGNQVTLGSQDVDNSEFFFLTVTGTQGGTGLVMLDGCALTGLVALECFAQNCSLTGTNTLRASTNTIFDQCKSAVAGTSTPEITFPGAGTTNLSFRHYSGGLQVNSATSLDTMSYESDGQLVIAATCTSLDVVVRGNCSVTDSGTTTVLDQDAAVTRSVVADSVWDEILTGATHNIATSAGRRLRGIQEFQGYENGAIWIDTVDGTAGTTDFENGTVENPVDSIADANTLAASLNIERFELAPGSSITFAASQNNQTFSGHNWTLALGGRDIAGSGIFGATVSGVASGTGTTQIFDKCILNATSHIKGTHLIECGIAGTQTIAEAGDFFTDRCHSAIAGTATPSWDFGGALNSSNLGFRNYSGGIEIQNMGAGTGSYTMSLEGRGQLIINANCSATSTVTIRGLFTVTDNAGGAVTLSDVARFAEDQNITTVTGNVDGSVATIGAGGVIDGAIAAAELLNIADACLDRRLDLGTDTGGNTTTSRTWRDALRVLRNRNNISGGTLTVYEEDDTTSAFTSTVSTTAGDPISQLNPA